jgi:hypothetical protein
MVEQVRLSFAYRDRTESRIPWVLGVNQIPPEDEVWHSRTYPAEVWRLDRTVSVKYGRLLGRDQFGSRKIASTFSISRLMAF